MNETMLRKGAIAVFVNAHSDEIWQTLNLLTEEELRQTYSDANHKIRKLAEVCETTELSDSTQRIVDKLYRVYSILLDYMVHKGVSIWDSTSKEI